MKIYTYFHVSGITKKNFLKKQQKILKTEI
jgi:hypothetical protein